MSQPFATIHECLQLDAEAEVNRIAQTVHRQVRYELSRGGAVVALSGGIDSTVVAGLCARALGKDKVIGLFLPERDSSAKTAELFRMAADHLGIRTFREDITPMLDACGCYRRRDEAIRSLIPAYRPDYRSKVVSTSLLKSGGLRRFSLVVESPEGRRSEAEAPIEILGQVVAATNFKQRVRKMIEYYYADRFHFAVAGTPNRLEYELGFFVKNGDGAADVKPIAHLYKSQVFQVARALGVPAAIQEQVPSTDTYSLSQTQEEFYFGLPLELLDLCLFCKHHGHTPQQTAEVTGLTAEQVQAVFGDIVAKRSLAEYLKASPLMVEPT